MTSPVRTPFQRNDAGFTLLEMLIALGLLALIVMLILSAIQSAGRALDVASRQIEEASTGSAQFVLRQIVAQARPIRMPAPNPEDGHMMEGNTERARFITSFAAGGQYGGLIDTGIFLRPALSVGDQPDLIIRQAIFRHPIPGSTAAPQMAHDIVILPRISKLSLRYYGKLDDDSQPIWQDTWANPTRLPLLVSISVTFPPADPRKWPDLIIPCRLAEE
ncbi:MAG: prepilin-type N-terminal cleavage/methylation domain-containing protein [Hyphomicrobiaceae bacterium]